jgi:hypothetical protein
MFDPFCGGVFVYYLRRELAAIAVTVAGFVADLIHQQQRGCQNSKERGASSADCADCTDFENS